MDDLNRTIDLLEQALVLTPQTDGKSWAHKSNSLDDSFDECFEMNGHIEDLNRSIGLIEAAADSASQGLDIEPQAKILMNLGYRLRRRFDWTGSMNDLNRAVTTCEKSLNLNKRDYALAERMTCLEAVCPEGLNEPG